MASGARGQSFDAATRRPAPGSTCSFPETSFAVTARRRPPAGIAERSSSGSRALTVLPLWRAWRRPRGQGTARDELAGLRGHGHRADGLLAVVGDERDRA